MVTTRKEVKHESVRIKRIVLDLHGVIVHSRMVVLFEYELQYSSNSYTLLLHYARCKNEFLICDNSYVPCISFANNYVLSSVPRNTLINVIFNWVSKVIRNCFVFALLRYVIGPENSRHFLNQSEAKLKPILATRVFPRFRWLVSSFY